MARRSTRHDDEADPLNVRILAHNRAAAHLSPTDSWTPPQSDWRSFCLHGVDPAKRPVDKDWEDCTEPERDRWRQFWVDLGARHGDPLFARRTERRIVKGSLARTRQGRRGDTGR
jgi:hypothetical protein